MICNLNRLFEQCPRHAIAAFNVFGYEDARMVVDAAEENHCPTILMVNRDAAAHMPLPLLGPLLRRMAEAANVPVAVHLDHAIETQSIREAVQNGFSSVMFDGSQLPFPENVACTCETMDIAKPLDVSVEAEIGSVAYSDPSIKAAHIYTDPEEAKAFWEATRVDCLAVSVGTVHRMTAQTARLQYDRLESIQKLIQVPLVIHGSTGVSDEDLKRLSREGVSKINIGTCLRMAFGRGLREAVQSNPDEFDRIHLFQRPMQLVKEAASQKMQLLLTPEACARESGRQA